MNRYTHKEQDFETQFCAGCGCDYYGEPDGCNHPNGACESFTYFTILADRLAAYEDTGLEPEDVETIKAVYVPDHKELKEYRSIGTVEEFRTLKAAEQKRREGCKWAQISDCNYKTNCGREITTPVYPTEQGWTTCMFCGRDLRGESHNDN